MMDNANAFLAGAAHIGMGLGMVKVDEQTHSLIKTIALALFVPLVSSIITVIAMSVMTTQFIIPQIQKDINAVEKKIDKEIDQRQESDQRFTDWVIKHEGGSK